MGLSQGGKLGFVLLTRIPPGAQVYPHTDKGWHAVNHQKFCVSVKANKSQAFCFEGEEMRTEAGDVFTFDNSHPHWVTNESDEERISLIICVRAH
jgi:aspartyl/asparaginyl beta-hydroxylase (cupin superfamily)